MFLPSHLRLFIENNILTTSESADLLGVHRNTITNLVKDGKIKPVKNSSGGMLFLRDDIEAYKRELTIGFKEIHGEERILLDDCFNSYGSTQFFKDNINLLQDIQSIKIYFDRMDAINDGYYIPSAQDKIGEVMSLNSPHMVITDATGREMWLNSCLCGYLGVGSRHTEEVLNLLHIPEKDIENIFAYRVVKFVKDLSGNMECYPSHSKFEDVIEGFTPYFFRGNLVLIHNKSSYSWDYNMEAVLKTFGSFISNPTEVIIFPNRKIAMDNGYKYYNYNGTLREQGYRLIIIDSSGRQLWLDPYIEKTKPLYYDENLRDILNTCGFALDDNKLKKLAETAMFWLNTNIRKRPIEPLIIKKQEE